jgi:hypothetical protein
MKNMKNRISLSLIKHLDTKTHGRTEVHDLTSAQNGDVTLTSLKQLPVPVWRIAVVSMQEGFVLLGKYKSLAPVGNRIAILNLSTHNLLSDLVQDEVGSFPHFTYEQCGLPILPLP